MNSDFEDEYVFKKERINIFKRMWRRVIIWWRLRQLRKDDPFIYEKDD